MATIEDKVKKKAKKIADSLGHALFDTDDRYIAYDYDDVVNSAIQMYEWAKQEVEKEMLKKAETALDHINLRCILKGAEYVNREFAYNLKQQLKEQ